MASPNIIVVSHNLEDQQCFASILAQLGLTPIIASLVSEAKAILHYHAISMVFCSDELPGSVLNEFIASLHQPFNFVPVVVFLRSGTWQSYLRYMEAGAFDCVGSPPRQDEIERILRRATAKETSNS